MNAVTSFGIGFVVGTVYSTKKLGHEYNELVNIALKDAKNMKDNVCTKAKNGASTIKTKFQDFREEKRAEKRFYDNPADDLFDDEPEDVIVDVVNQSTLNPLN